MGAGAGFDYLAQAGAQNAANKSADKRQLSDEERHAHVDELTGNIAGMQTKLATLDPGSPEYASLSDDITKAHGMLTNAFHPENNQNPMNAFAHLGRMISQKFLHKPAPTETEVSRPEDAPRISTVPGQAAVPSTTQPGMTPGTTLTTAAIPATAPEITVGPAKAGPLVSRQVPVPTAAEAKQRANEMMARFGIEATPAPVPKPDLEKVVWLAGHDGKQQPFKLVDGAYQPVQGAEGFAPAQKPGTLTADGVPYTGPDGTVMQNFKDAQGNITAHEAPEGTMVKPPATPHQSTAAMEMMIRGWFPKGPTAEQREWGIRKFQKMMHPDTSATHESIQYNTVTGEPIIVPLHAQASKGWGSVGPPPPDADGAAAEAPPRQVGTPAPASTPASLKKTAAAVAPKKSAQPAPTGQAKAPSGRLAGLQHATPTATVARKLVDAAENSYLDVQKASSDPTPVGDQGVILAWLRGRVNRVTATEIAAVNNLGGIQMRLEGNVAKYVSGKMTDQQRQWFLRSAKDNYDNAKTVASKYDLGAAAPTGQAGGFNWDEHPTVK